jgi:transposase
VIRLVVDNLNTHSPAALYATFSPTEAHRIARKLEFHYTPKNSSWLNMAELEFSALARQCLDRRIADTVALRTHTDARTLARNAARATVIWRFTMTNARIRLIRLYPA